MLCRHKVGLVLLTVSFAFFLQSKHAVISIPSIVDEATFAVEEEFPVSVEDAGRNLRAPVVASKREEKTALQSSDRDATRSGPSPSEVGIPYLDPAEEDIQQTFHKILPHAAMWKHDIATKLNASDYHHPLGACEKSKGIRVKNVTRVVLNGTRVWTTIFPDQRHKFATHHERCHSVLARMLGILSVILDEQKLHNDWFLTHATLLGAVRHRGFVPWDNDIDIAMSRPAMVHLEKIWTSEFPRDMFLQTRVTDPKYNYQVGKNRDVFRVHDRYSCYPHYRFNTYKKGPRYHHTGPQIDIVPIWGKPRMLGGVMLLQTFISKKRGILWPTKKMCFESMSLPVPGNTFDVLKTIYGPDFMTQPSIEEQAKSFAYGNTCRTTAMCAVKGVSKSKWTLNYDSDFNTSTGEVIKTSGRDDPWNCWWNRHKMVMRCDHQMIPQLPRLHNLSKSNANRSQEGTARETLGGDP